MNHEQHRTHCHTEGTHIVTLNHCNVYASSNKHPYHGYAFVINLSGYAHADTHTATPHRGAEHVCQRFLAALPTPQYVSPPELEIAWRDGDVPDLTKRDWKHLIKDFEHLKGRVLVHCIGGHGRTGTFCAIMLALTGVLRKDPVEWLRKNYCAKAVETKKQFDYLQQLGIKTACAPKPMMMHHVHVGMQGDSMWLQQQYRVTHPSTAPLDSGEDVQPRYTCMLCKRPRVKSYFHQVFADMTGMCHQCHTMILCDAKDIREDS